MPIILTDPVTKNEFVPFYRNRNTESCEYWAAYRFPEGAFDGTNLEDGDPTVVYKLENGWRLGWEWDDAWH